MNNLIGTIIRGVGKYNSGDSYEILSEPYTHYETEECEDEDGNLYEEEYENVVVDAIYRCHTFKYKDHLRYDWVEEVIQGKNKSWSVAGLITEDDYAAMV